MIFFKKKTTGLSDLRCSDLWIDSSLWLCFTIDNLMDELNAI